MPDELPSGRPLAVLIDADNANLAAVEAVLAEVAKLGVANVKRAYGDWTRPQLAQWKDALLKHSIQPVQQFAYATGKNATDMAMVIDAMDLLYTGSYSGFCLVSSDSDFTRLASRLREAGKRVFGFGERNKTAQRKSPLVAACDRFIYTDLLSAGDAPPSVRVSQAELQSNAELVDLLRSAIDAASDEAGRANLATVGSTIRKQSPDFDERSYGYKKLSDLVEAIGLFKVDRRDGAVFISDEPSKVAP